MAEQKKFDNKSTYINSNIKLTVRSEFGTTDINKQTKKEPKHALKEQF